MYNGYTTSSDGYTWVYRDAFNNNLFNLPCMQKLSSAVNTYISSFIETSATTYTIRSICWDYTQSVWLASIAWNNTNTVNSVYTYVAVSSDAISWASLQEMASGSTSPLDQLLVGYVNVLLPTNTTTSNRFLASSNNSRVIASWGRNSSNKVCASTDGGAWTESTSLSNFTSFTTNGVVWVGCGNGTDNTTFTSGTKLYVSDDLQTFSSNIGQFSSGVVWSGKMWVSSLVDINGNWTVYYTYDATARSGWILNTTRPTGGRKLRPYNLMYNGMYFIIAGREDTTVYFSTSTDANIWTNWVTAPMSGGTSFAIATKNVLPSINTSATSMGPTGPTSAPSGSYITQTSNPTCNFTLFSNTLTAGGSFTVPITGAGFYTTLFTTYINPTSTSTYLVTLNFTYTSVVNTDPIVFTLCRQTGSTTTNSAYATNNTNLYNNVKIATPLSFANNNFLAIDNANSATTVPISITVVDTVQNNTPFVYSLWASTASGFGTSKTFTTNNPFLNITQLTL
jgi:hypothetical protein